MHVRTEQSGWRLWSSGVGLDPDKTSPKKQQQIQRRARTEKIQKQMRRRARTNIQKQKSKKNKGRRRKRTTQIQLQIQIQTPRKTREIQRRPKIQTAGRSVRAKYAKFFFFARRLVCAKNNAMFGRSKWCRILALPFVVAYQTNG